MSEHPMIAEATRRAEELARGYAEYTGGAKFFHHMGHKREAAYPWLSDVEIAGEVRMLMRNDVAHEAIVCAARDRILHLSEEVERLRGSAWLPIRDYVRAKHGAHVLGWNEKFGNTEFLLHDDGWTVATFNGQIWRGSPEKFMPMPVAPTRT